MSDASGEGKKIHMIEKMRDRADVHTRTASVHAEGDQTGNKVLEEKIEIRTLILEVTSRSQRLSAVLDFKVLQRNYTHYEKCKSGTKE